MQNPFSRNHLIRDAIGRALYDAMKLDPSIYLFGEGAEIKMHYDAPQIERDFPDRVVTLPISEDANTNFAVGASLLGIKPVVDVITSDFMYRTFDAIANTAAKLNFVQAEGEPPKTIVIRSEFLIGGPTTGQRPEALFVHIPGLNVVIPSTPNDAYGLMRTALTSPGVTIFLEDRMILDSDTQPEDMDGVGIMAVPFGQASMRMRPPRATLTIVTYGLMRQVVELALNQERVNTVELIDLKTLYPIDWATLFDSTERTGKLLIVEPDVLYGGIGAEIAATAVDWGVSKISRLGAPRETIPASRDGHALMLPSGEKILAVIRRMEGYGPGLL
mgnify:FL=1